MRISAVLLFLVGTFGLFGCSETPEEPRTGTISAFANDPNIGAVVDVEVILLPDNVTKTTDESGLVSFVVPAGEYFIDVKLCCNGPGFIEYHVPITVREGETARVELIACLVCV